MYGVRTGLFFPSCGQNVTCIATEPEPQSRVSRVSTHVATPALFDMSFYSLYMYLVSAVLKNDTVELPWPEDAWERSSSSSSSSSR